MTLSIKIFAVGPLENNVVLVYGKESKKAVLIDPSFESKPVLDFIKEEGLSLEKILITHAHFDHIAGVLFIRSHYETPPKVYLHSSDLALWIEGGGSKKFNILMELPGAPDVLLEDAQTLELGAEKIEVRLSPGHSHGSVIYYFPSIKTAVVGDVIFYHGIGRTDLPGGSYSTLIKSIKSKVFTLPPDTILIPGHGQETNVAEEVAHNPFLDI